MQYCENNDNLIAWMPISEFLDPCLESKRSRELAIGMYRCLPRAIFVDKMPLIGLILIDNINGAIFIRLTAVQILSHTNLGYKKNIS